MISAGDRVHARGLDSATATHGTAITDEKHGEVRITWDTGRTFRMRADDLHVISRCVQLVSGDAITSALDAAERVAL